jgi:excisionase family DNA binding protein
MASRSITSEPAFETPIMMSEASRLVGIPRKTLLRLAAQNRFPAAKIGKIWVTRKSAIDNWLNEKLNSSREKSASSGEQG